MFSPRRPCVCRPDVLPRLVRRMLLPAPSLIFPTFQPFQLPHSPFLKLPHLSTSYSPIPTSICPNSDCLTSNSTFQCATCYLPICQLPLPLLLPILLCPTATSNLPPNLYLAKFYFLSPTPIAYFVQPRGYCDFTLTYSDSNPIHTPDSLHSLTHSTQPSLFLL